MDEVGAVGGAKAFEDAICTYFYNLYLIQILKPRPSAVP